MQLEHHEIKNKTHNYDITLVLEHLQSPQNIGMIIRTAEAMGVKTIYVISEVFNELSSKMKKISRDTSRHIHIEFFKDWECLLSQIVNLEGGVIALEKTSSSISYKTYNFPDHITIICGNESKGVSEKALAMCSKHLHIDMYGENTSLNVAVATAILLSQIVP